MPKSNGDGNGRGEWSRRDQAGLTDRMRRALPILSTSVTVRRGVQECAEKKITSMQNFYQRWMPQDAFRKALKDARDIALGEVAQRARDLAIVNIENAVLELMQAASKGQKGTGQVRAIESLLALCGLDEFRRGGSTNVSVLQVNENAEVRKSRKGRLAAHLSRNRVSELTD